MLSIYFMNLNQFHFFMTFSLIFIAHRQHVTLLCQKSGSESEAILSASDLFWDSNTAPELTLCRNPQHISKYLRHFYDYLLVFTYNDTYAKALPYSVSDPRVKNSVSVCQTV